MKADPPMIQIQDLSYDDFIIVINMLKEIREEVNKIGEKIKDINT